MRKRNLFVLLLLGVMLVLAGCGDHSGPTIFSTQILSDPVFDGDIAQDPLGNRTVTQGNTQSVFVGVDPATGDEFRGFLDFPLEGPNGVPINAFISSAFLNIAIQDLIPLASTVPVTVELVDPHRLTLFGSDFDENVLPALASTTITPPIDASDLGHEVSVDVTPLMRKAQQLGLADFQLRLVKGPGPDARIEINDTTASLADRSRLAPLLQVEYFF